MAKEVITLTEEKEATGVTEQSTGPTSLRKYIAIVSICALTLVIVLLIITIIVLIKHNNRSVTVNLRSSSEEKIIRENDFDTTSRISLGSALNENKTSPTQLKLVSRLEWTAQPPIEQPNILSTPVPYVIIHHTATENCSTKAQCILHVRFIQNFHMGIRQWWDIGYNFLVGGDGSAYEGRGWKGEGAHASRFNSKSIGIAFIGSFNAIKPPQKQIDACKQLIAKGVELGYIKEDYKLFAASQLMITSSPGKALYEDIQTWNHWAWHS